MYLYSLKNINVNVDTNSVNNRLSQLMRYLITNYFYTILTILQNLSRYSSNDEKKLLFLPINMSVAASDAIK